MQQLVIGKGEIGTAIAEIFQCDAIDKGDKFDKTYDVIHVCIGHSRTFEKTVLDYIKIYKPKYTVVHSTVPVGTCDKHNWVHFPITGVHPHLKESILTFRSLVGGKRASELKGYFGDHGIDITTTEKAGNTEAGKLYNLLTYGINVLIEKEIHQYCEDNDLDYEFVYNEFVTMYNDGYEDMGMNWARMYYLMHKEGGIGGHCVMQNAPKLKTKFSRLLESYNKQYMV